MAAERLLNAACIVAGCFAVILVIAPSLPRVANVRPVRDAIDCRHNLESVFGRLVEYGKTHDTFPQTPHGNLDLEAIYAALGISESQRQLCPTNNNFDCYVFRRGLKPADLILDRHTDIPWTIIAMDKPGNHPFERGAYANKFRVNCLFSCDAASVSMILSQSEYDLFARRLAKGQLFDNSGAVYDK